MQYTILFGVAVGLLSMSLSAADDVTDLERVIVSAARTPVPVDDVASSITVITREELERRQTVFVADLLRGVPGVAVSRAGSHGAQTQIRIRGAEANHVLVIVDGVEANDPAAGDEFQFEHLTSADIERIEIVRGPQSALWGSDALAGVIHVITRRDTAPLAAGGLLEGGSFGSLRASGNVSVASAHSSLSGAVSHLRTDGTNISRSGGEDDGYKNTGLRLTARTAPIDSLELELFARHSEISKEFDAIDFTTGLPTDADLHTDTTQTYLRAGGDLSLFDGRWRQSLKMTALRTDNDNYADGNASDASEADKWGVYYQSTLGWLDDEQMLTLAIDHEQEEFAQTGVATPFGDPNQRQRLHDTGYVVEYRGRLTDRFGYSAGLRYDANSDFGDTTTYRLTASYLLADGGTRLHASYGTGQKSPTFIERFGFFPDAFLGNPQLEPEHSRGWEVGIRQRLLERRVQLAATYFDERLQDEIDGFVFDPGSGLFTAANRAGHSRRNGVELSLTASPSDRLDVTATYTYTDATEPQPGAGQVDELRRPRHIGSLNVYYTAFERLRVHGGISYSGSQLDLFFPPFPEPSQRVRLDGYTLVDLALSYRIATGVEWIARLENAFDERYENLVGFNAPGVGAYTGLRFSLE